MIEKFKELIRSAKNFEENSSMGNRIELRSIIKESEKILNRKNKFLYRFLYWMIY